MTAKEVALWFLNRNRMDMLLEDADYISNLKLQKLLYYAQGTFLAVKNKKLFDDDILAWAHGPVVESVYHEYKANGSQGIIEHESFDFDKMSKEDEELLEEVYDVFAQYSAWKLRNMTHEETPWKDTKQNEIIKTELIKQYFKETHLV